MRRNNGKLEVIGRDWQIVLPHRAGEHNGVIDFIGWNGLTSIDVDFGASL